jgi:AcrR family transcriptional regulator
MDVRTQILAEATRLFAANGFDGTPLQAIADAVGIRKPSLLYHFSSKDELRRSVLDTLLSHWKDRLPYLLRAATSGEDQFNSVVMELVGFFTADPQRARLLVREVLDRPDEVRALIENKVQPWVGIVTDYIRKGQDRGDVYADLDPEAYCAQVINLVIASVATWDCIGAFLPGDKDAAFQKHIDELLRVARTSMFRVDPGKPTDSE